MSLSLFLDTNIYLHYKHIEEIDFCEIYETDKITIIIPSTVLHELDKNKDTNKNIDIRQRARKILKFIDQLGPPEFEKTIKNKVTLKLKLIEPVKELESNQLDQNTPDDRIIASILSYKSNHPDESITFISSDTTPRKKAQLYGITADTLPSKYRLAISASSEQKKIKELEKEILMLKHRIPNLSLKFDNKKEFAEYKILEPFSFNDSDKEKVLDGIKYLHQKFSKQEDGTFSEPQNSLSGFIRTISHGFGPTEEQIVEYNEDIEKYYSECINYFDLWEKYKNIENLTVKVIFSIENSGTTPSEDIDINLHVPDGCEVLSKGSLVQQPFTPSVPSRPKSIWAELANSPKDFNYNSVSHILPPSKINIEKINASSPKIKKSNSYDIHYHVNKLKHDNSILLEPIYISFPSYESASSLSIDYKINAENIPESIFGKLNIKIVKESTDYRSSYNKEIFELLKK